MGWHYAVGEVGEGWVRRIKRCSVGGERRRGTDARCLENATICLGARHIDTLIESFSRVWSMFTLIARSRA